MQIIAPNHGRPSRRTGAERFGWGKRDPIPAKIREGRWLIGLGVAAAFRNNLLMKSAARVRLDRRGVVTVETDMTDIGTGSYTIIAQTAAEMMGVPLDKVVVRLGDSTFPVSCGSGGQWGGNNATAGVYAACAKLREAVAQKLGFNTVRSDLRGRTGAVQAAAASRSPMQRAMRDLVAEDTIEYGDLAKTHQQSTFGAHFVEVGVDSAPANPCATDACGMCGRTHSESQGRALPGDRRDDHGRRRSPDGRTRGRQACGFFRQPRSRRLRSARQRGHPASGCDFPRRNRPHVITDEGERCWRAGICDVGVAVANAIYNATGIRVRDYPIMLDKLLDRMPDV